MKKFRKNNKGFTLVELIIVIAIIAVLTAVLAPRYITYVMESKNGVVEEAAHQVATILKAEGALGHITGDESITVKEGAYPTTPTNLATGYDEADWQALVGEVADNDAEAVFTVAYDHDTGTATVTRN